MIHRKCKMILCACAAVLTMLAAGCGSSSDSAKSASQDKPKLVDTIKSRGELVIGTATGYPPYIFLDTSKPGKVYAGLDIMLAQKVADKLGVKLKVQDMVFQALLSSLSSNKVDLAIGGINPTDERRKTFDFSDVYLVSHNRMIIRKADADTYKTIADFKGQTIGVQKSSTQENVAQTEMPDSKVASLAHVPDAVLELTQGKVAGVIAEDVVAQQYLMMNSNLMMLDITFQKDKKESAICVNKGNEDLLAVLNEVIKEEKANGDMDKFLDESDKLAVGLAKQ